MCLDPATRYRDFPNLRREECRNTSAKSKLYNCFAWALDDIERKWAPVEGYYWPGGIPREETLTAYERAYGLYGYERCASEGLEAGFEKIAIFWDEEGVPTHAARQLENGHWTSKIGDLEDIEHFTLRALQGPLYGVVAVVLRRRKVRGES